ncbi:hypothetical protein FBU30_009697 [Linnemannia zychae]|nr:hypothetical protein FBU30_009697 [Linnemannia zychae]
MDGQAPAKLSLDSLMSTVLPSLDVGTSSSNATKKFKRVRPPPGSTSTAPPASAPLLSSTMPMPAAVVSNPHIPKNTPSDIAAAAQAVFAAPSSSTPTSTTNSNNNAKTKSNKKRNRKQKKKNNGDLQDGPQEPPTAVAVESNTLAPSNQAGPGKQTKHSNHKKSKFESQMIARNLDAQPELVGVSKDDDFSELLIQHVTHSNKMLQRDLEEQSKKMIEEQERQAKLLADQAAGLTAPGDIAADQGSLTSFQPNQGQQQHGLHNTNNNNNNRSKNNKNNKNNDQKLKKQNRNNPGSDEQSQQKRQQTPFAPKKDCVYFLQGTCRRAVCTFKHDIAAQQAAMAANEAEMEAKREASRKERGICNFEKSGTCAKGDMCPYSHDLSDEPCTYYHLRGICERGALCRFGHTPISDERLNKLRVDLEIKLREKRDMEANANANAQNNVPFQIGVSSIGTQGHYSLNEHGLGQYGTQGLASVEGPGSAQNSSQSLSQFGTQGFLPRGS